MFIVQQLCRSYLQPMNLEMNVGECLSIRGPSGAGKSLLLRAIADLDPSEGRVSLDDIARDSMEAYEWRRLVTYVPAESGWWADSVAAHFDEPDIAAGYLIRFGFPDSAMSWPTDRLSTGERQRLGLLRAIVQNPRVLLLDEPTSALDPEATAKVEGVLREKLDAGVSIIMVSHDAAQAKRLAHRQFVINDGALAEETS